MFISRKEYDKLCLDLDKLRLKLLELEDKQKNEISTLKTQLGRISSGLKLTPEAITEGHIVNVVKAERLDGFLMKNTDIILLDVRTDAEWNVGHIEGAIHIDVGALPKALAQLPDKNKAIMAYCASGNRSIQALELLYKNGYLNLWNVEGGINAYRGKIVTS